MEAAKNLRIMLGKKLCQLRKERGLSQEKLARLAGMKQPMINRFETGDRRINVDHAEKLASVLGIVPAELLSPGINTPAWQAATRTTQGVDIPNSLLADHLEDYLADYIKYSASKEGAYAIAFALLKLADVLGQVTDRSPETASE